MSASSSASSLRRIFAEGQAVHFFVEAHHIGFEQQLCNRLCYRAKRRYLLAVRAERVEPFSELFAANEYALERQVYHLHRVRFQKLLCVVCALEALKMLRDYVQAVVVRYSDIDYRRGIAAQRAYIHFRYRIPRG